MPRWDTTIVRFVEKINAITEAGCWLWTNPSSNGYGRFNHIGAHRFAYIFFRDEIPEGLETDHLCRNRACVNPYHLELVTRSENLRRGKNAEVARQRTARIVICKHGHAYTPENTKYDKKGKRYCRECHRLSAERAYRR